MFELNGRVGIVTGASSGIGFAVANTLAEAGATVIAISRTGRPKEVGTEILPGIKHVAADITNYSELEKTVRKYGEEKGLDFLINNAGITIKKRAEIMSDEEFEQVHRVNVFSVFKLCQLCYPYLKKSKKVGRIVSISSMAAYLGFSEVVPYCSSKSAVTGLTRGLAIEWAQDNILVNSVAPGWFPSEMTKSVMDDKRKEKILERMPLHQFGESKDIGAMVQFLLSDSATYITGQDFPVDAGALVFGF